MINLREKTTVTEVASILNEFDLDGDHHISLGEFQKMLPKVFDLDAHPMEPGEVEQMYESLMILGDGDVVHLQPMVAAHGAANVGQIQRLHLPLPTGGVRGRAAPEIFLPT